MKLDLIAMILCLAVGIACGAISGFHVGKRIVTIAAELAGCEIRE